MIFYFSAEGNSEWVARTLGQRLQERVISIAELWRNGDFCYQSNSSDKVGFVFPVHAWGIPLPMEFFIRRLQLENCTHPYIFMVCTCGDDVGLLDRDFARLMQAKGWECAAAYSITMPNTYVCLPGMDVDNADLESRKRKEAECKMDGICRNLEEHRKGICKVTPGRMPWLKSRVLRPLFSSLLMTDRFFKVTEDCISCGKCVEACTVQNILLEDGRPKWQGNCAGCLACYHHCPKHAIRFGKMTEHKGQYTF